MKLTGRSGVLRVYDSSDILHGAAPLDNLIVDMVKFDGVTTWTNITTDVETDDAAAASAFLADTADMVAIGSTGKFARVKYLKGAGVNYAAGSGALIAKYWNGVALADLSGVSDGTASGGDCFAADGIISFRIPRDWAIGANAYNASLDADKYYVFLAETTSSVPDPDADVLCPCDGQYFEIAFAGMDFSGPIGRKRTEEQLVLDRQSMSSRAHYIEGSDDPLYEPMEVAYGAMIDSTYNKDDIMVAHECGDPDSARWTATGVSSKGSTMNDGSNANPAFQDSSKKALNVQILWTGANPIGMAYYEVYYPPEGQELKESAEGISVAMRGGCYGVIETIYGFGNRY